MEITTEIISYNNFEEIGKTLIEKNWQKINNSFSDMLQKNIKQLEIKIAETSKYKIIILLKNNIRKVIINDRDKPNYINCFTISDKLRKINFVYYENKISHKKLNTILNPNEIQRYIKEYHIKNPIYYLNNKIHIKDSLNLNNIFGNELIKESIDLNMEDIPNSNCFMDYLQKCYMKLKIYI